jgi:hypothetical protein
MLGACASVTYEQPASGDRARVRFAVIDGFRAGLPASTATVFNYDDENCKGQRQWMYLINGLYARPDPRRLDMPLWDFHDNGAKEFYVESGRPLYFMIATDAFTGGGLYGSTSVICAVPVFVTFETDHDYELLFQLRDTRTCTVTMNEIVNDTTGPRRVERAFFDNSRFPSAGCRVAFSRLFY